MKKRVIKFGPQAREHLAKGAKKLHDGVVRTLGPWGETVFLDKRNTITNDGVSVANEIQLPDEVENRGALAMREASKKTVERVGDGTTTAVAIAFPLYEDISALLGDTETIGNKRSAADIRIQLEKEKKLVLDELASMSVPLETEQDLINSAKVATGSDELADLIGKAQFEVGKEGILTAELTNEPVSSVEKVQGIRFDNGLTSGRLVNNLERDCFEIDNVRVILTGQIINDWVGQMVPILESLGKQNADMPVVVIARAFTSQVMEAFANNLQKGRLKAYPMNAPYTDMADVMKDLAAYTGATYFDDEGTKVKDMQLSDVGMARRVEVFRWHTMVVSTDDERTKERIAIRVKELEEKIKGTTSDFHKKLLETRKAQLGAGVRIIKVGNTSEMERQRLFDKADDAVNAVRAAYQEGVVPGAGMAYQTIAGKLPEGALLKRALEAPAKQIASTAPTDFKVEDWVRDPVKVLRIALEQAVEAAMVFASAGGVITEAFPKSLDELIHTRPMDNTPEPN